MTSSIWMWVGFNLLVLILLAFDLGLLHKKQREIRVREALWLSFGYFVIACLFGLGIFQVMGRDAGYEFFTGYLIEKSLSLDNIFVFALIFTHLAVPSQYQHRVLFWGILGALVMRAALIAAGATLISTVHWIVLLFGAFLIFTGIKMLLTINAKPDLENNRFVLLARRLLRITPDYRGEKFFVREGGALWATPLFLALVLVEATDLVFALDSIPAIFAITKDPFIVYTSNVFAILGLRALYFALAGIIHRFHYLKYGLSLVLVVVGTKMILNGFFGEKIIPVEAALLVTLLLIGGSMLISLWTSRGAAPDGTLSGWVPGSRPRAADATDEHSKKS